jgi:hypothetical protein
MVPFAGDQFLVSLAGEKDSAQATLKDVIGKVMDAAEEFKQEPVSNIFNDIL